MEAYDLDAMFTFTVAMGLTAFVMAWEIACIALKAWATRRTKIAVVNSLRLPASP